MWIFWALLQRKYYICYALGGTKEAKLKNATTDEKRLQIEYDYTNAGKTSQTIALLLLCGVLVVAFVVLSVARCCCQREIGSLPSDDEVERLESEAAVKAFRKIWSSLHGSKEKNKPMCIFRSLLSRKEVSKSNKKANKNKAI